MKTDIEHLWKSDKIHLMTITMITQNKRQNEIYILTKKHTWTTHRKAAKKSNRTCTDDNPVFVRSESIWVTLLNF